MTPPENAARRAVVTGSMIADEVRQRRRNREQSRADPHLFDCCEHCGCGGPDGIWRERLGHDDTCAKGCNDDD